MTNGSTFKKIATKLRGGRVSFRPAGTSRGNVLISYIITPFFQPKTAAETHTNIWECQEMVRAFLEAGYSVDVISHDNNRFVPKKKYSYFIDIHSNLDRLTPLLNKDCVKIFHATGSHWIFQNHAEYERLLALQQRRSVALVPRRSVSPSLAIENADLVTMLGNDATESTYRYAQKKIFRIPLSATHTYPFPQEKNISVAKKNFVWFGGGGMVHKGLDLILEAFSGMPEYRLSVCGSVKAEPDFEKAYWKELYKTSNIKTFDKVDPAGKIFGDIIESSVALLYPSCSEGQSGAVVTCMHAGLIPAISSQSGIDIEDFGIELRECTIEEIRNTVRAIASMDEGEIVSRSKKAWEYARAHHTREKWSAAFREFLEALETRKTS